MSTRANIVITDSNHDRLYFYRHSDGYPRGTMPTLTAFLDMVKQKKIRDNTLQAAGWLIMLGAEEHEQTLAKCLAQPKNDYMSWKVGAYEPTTCIHGDVEYIYVVNLATKRVLYCKSYGHDNDLEILLNASAKEEDERARMAAHVCEDDDDFCEECCPHDEHDHGICLYCGKDNTDHFVGMAESYYEGER